MNNLCEAPNAIFFFSLGFREDPCQDQGVP